MLSSTDILKLLQILQVLQILFVTNLLENFPKSKSVNQVDNILYEKNVGKIEWLEKIKTDASLKRENAIR